ncbi:MAG: hypothetical protein LBD28_07940 [Tannerellaceae bacterium]|jgi:epoxyqueuosine reductase QueG|nr:hypothetical protein [Tannerellaceae bacterium]
MKEEIRELITLFGANICGFAGLDRIDNSPVGFHPKDIFPDCQSVIAFGIALPNGLAKVSPRLIYGYYNNLSVTETDRIALKAAKRLEDDYHCIAVPMPCDVPYEYWDLDTMEGRGLLSIRHIAVAAGLGTIGKNTLLLNRRFGNRLTLGAILTDLKLTSDSLSLSVCIEKCRKCIDSCPVNAIKNGAVNQKLCRAYTYGKTERGFDTVNCNRCRTICPVGSSAIQ